MQLVIEPGGNARCVYDEAIDLRVFGRVEMARGSHVEPDADGRWWADMAPLCGPVLGPYPRTRRRRRVAE